MTLKTFLLIFLRETVNTVEQVVFKKAANKFTTKTLKTFKDYLLFFKEAFTSPLIWAGFIVTAITWVIWLAALANAQLSVAIPVTSIHYLIILLAAHFILKERLDVWRISGAILIMLGIILLVVK